MGRALQSQGVWSIADVGPRTGGVAACRALEKVGHGRINVGPSREHRGRSVSHSPYALAAARRRRLPQRHLPH